MENTNQLHEKEYIDSNRFRTFPTAKGSIVTKSGLTKKLTEKESKILFEKVENGEFLGEINVEIEFSTDAQGLKLAKKFSRLAENPAVKLNVQFKKITKHEEIKN